MLLKYLYAFLSSLDSFEEDQHPRTTANTTHSCIKCLGEYIFVDFINSNKLRQLIFNIQFDSIYCKYKNSLNKPDSLSLSCILNYSLQKLYRHHYLQTIEYSQIIDL